jgi:hypothetical protein
MAQCEQKLLYFDVASEADRGGFLDLSSAVTAANRVQYHQVSQSGAALCYRVRLTAIKGDFVLTGLSSAFITCNAVKQASAGWKAQLKHAGVKLRDLSPMGRRARFGLSRHQITENERLVVGVPDPVFEISAINLQPLRAPGGSKYFSTYTSTDDKSVSYHSFPAPTVDDLAANQVTQVTVTDGAGAESNLPMVMTGSVSGEFNVLNEYMNARRQSPDVSIDTPGPDGHSAMLNLFSIAEEMSDDIIEGVEHYMDYKPYTPDHSTNTHDETIQLGEISSVTSAIVQYPPQSVVVDAPLGLIGLAATASSNLQVEVLAIYEM